MEQTEPKDISLEKHWTVPEVSKLWRLDQKTVRRWFVGEPGVVEWGSAETRYGRKRTYLRIPESVMMRVHRKKWRSQ